MLVTPCIGRTIRLCTKSLVHDVDDDNNNTEILLLTSLPLCTCPPGCRAVSEHSHVATAGVAEGDVGGRVHDVSERKRVLTTTQTSLNSTLAVLKKEGGRDVYGGVCKPGPSSYPDPIIYPREYKFILGLG